MKKYWILGISLVALLLTISSCQSAREVPYKEVSFTVEPLQKYIVNITMHPGNVLEGYLSVTNGNNDIHFYLEDSDGKKILDINRVQGRYDFSYEATSEGVHKMVFDNGFSSINSKQVLIHFRIR